MMGLKHSDEEIKKAVRLKYTEIATAGLEQCEWEADAGKIAKAGYLGYDIKKLSRMPGGMIDTFCGCGNPLTKDKLKPGEIVLDLGSGGGLDCFLAAELVGDKGKVIGLDMTKEMLRKAQMGANKLKLRNVEFKRGDIEDIPLENGSVDVVISNCVINLSPNKDKVFRESFRVLKPRGRLIVCDVVSKEDIPKDSRNNLDIWVLCQGGVVKEEEYIEKIRKAGFEKIEIVSKAPFEGLVSAKIKALKPA